MGTNGDFNHFYHMTTDGRILLSVDKQKVNINRYFFTIFHHSSFLLPTFFVLVQMKKNERIGFF